MIEILKKILIIGASFFALASYSPSLVQAQSVTLELQQRVNLIVVEVTINGVAKNFVLDTGASITVFDSRITRDLGLERISEGTAVVAGTEIPVSIVSVDSISVGSIVLHEFMCGAADLGNLKVLLGDDIIGVLGFDFLSNFEMILDYCDKKITFNKCQQEISEPACDEDSAIVPQFGIVRISNDYWECTTETPMRQILVAFYNTRYSGLAATLQIQNHEIEGVTALESVASMIEPQLKSQISNFDRISGRLQRLGNREIYVLMYKGSEQGIDLKFKHIFIIVKESLFSIICYAPAERFDSLEPDFDEIVTNIRFEK